MNRRKIKKALSRFTELEFKRYQTAERGEDASSLDKQCQRYWSRYQKLKNVRQEV